VLCKFHHQTCLFNENPQPRKRRKISDSTSAAVPPSESTVQSVTTPNALPLDPSADASANIGTPGSGSEKRPHIRMDRPIDDYANLKGPSLLKKTLGLQNHRHSKMLGKTSQFDHTLLSLSKPNNTGTGPGGGEIPLGPSHSLRKVTHDETFLLIPDSTTVSHAEEQQDLDTIESLVAPHGAALIHLYFRIVHPTFPVLHKRVYLEKYQRTHREFSPPLLAAVYLMAINWWSYSAELSLLSKPDVAALEAIAQRTMSYIISRPKLSTLQAGLLLLQRPEAAARDSSWALTGQLVALGQDLGLHLDCARWRIPQWERGLRKRLGWALFMQDKWGALMHGRPSHIHGDDWAVRPLVEADFPERAADEDDEEGSTEVEKGRVLFCEMIKLTGILARILCAFYTLRAEEEFQAKEREGAGAEWVLERAKGMQISLKEWYSQLPESLRMESVKPRKLSSNGIDHNMCFTSY
jgi:Fungal specific transcription factor domain